MTSPWLVLGIVAVLALHVAWRFRKGERLFDHSQQRDATHRWGDRCAYRWPVTWHRCRDGIQWDHQIPYSRGGRTRVGNCQPLCGAVNRRKGATFNVWYVIRHGWVIGSLVYLVRWVRAEGMRR